MPHIYAESNAALRKAVEEAGRKRGYRLVFFTCFGDNGTIDLQESTNEKYDEGERAIFRLSNLNAVDGIIFLYDVFAHSQYDEIRDLVRNRCKVPVVNFRTPMEVPGVHHIFVDDRSSFADIIQHFIDIHHAETIDLVTGPKDNIHSTYRLNTFKEVLEKNNIPYDERRVHWGNFWKNCGEDIVQEMMHSQTGLPQAIVCANDYMAISVIEALKKRGILVPDQILVSGYDNLEEGKYNHPSLTTVSQPVKAMGECAIDMLEKIWAGEEAPEEVYVPEEAIYRQSCGCAKAEDFNLVYSNILNAKVDKICYLETAATTMITMMSNSVTMEEALDQLAHYALRDNGFKSFALCLADHWEKQLSLPDVGYGASECMITMVMGLFHGERMERERFPVCQLLPEAFARDDEPVYIMPVHYLQYYMGYAIVQLDYDVSYNANIKSWFLHLDSMLENIRMRERLGQVVSELRDLYVRDTLTGLYNRRGLEKYGMRFYQDCKERGEQFMIMEVDMDGLKQVNDEYGHEEGDVCITTIANGLTFASREGEICIRSGGDEYVVLGRNYSQEKLDRYLALFDEFILNANESMNKEYRFGASVGYYLGVPDETHTMENYMKIADDRMYENKKKRKEKSHPGVGVR